jgi:hypothetical protein
MSNRHYPLSFSYCLFLGKRVSEILCRWPAGQFSGSCAVWNGGIVSLPRTPCLFFCLYIMCTDFHACVCHCILGNFEDIFVTNNTHEPVMWYEVQSFLPLRPGFDFEHCICDLWYVRTWSRSGTVLLLRTLDSICINLRHSWPANKLFYVSSWFDGGCSNWGFWIVY